LLYFFSSFQHPISNTCLLNSINRYDYTYDTNVISYVGTPTGEAKQGRIGKQEERNKREEQMLMGRNKQEEILKNVNHLD